ncbi:MAG: DUF2798 domain-containing protein [Rhodoferax sp.]|nr:MAG: DUF2798 domain-containing protein [Rhodoferax sp.]
MLPARFFPAVFAFLLSGLMSLIVSGISTLRVSGLAPNFLEMWTGAWLMAWVIAFPTVLVVAPFTRRIAQRLVGTPAG